MNEKPIFDNILNYSKISNSIYVYYHQIKNKYNFTYEQKKYQNTFLFNFDHSRFFTNNTKHDFDPLIYTDEKYKWPEYVKYIYYTNMSTGNKIVQLSYINNLYLNLCFSRQNYASLYRTGFYMVYDLISINKKILSSKDIFETIKTSDLDVRNIEVFYKTKYQNFINFKYKDLIKRDINEKQITGWSYKNFFDYIPVCFMPYNEETLMTSNICFHNNNCHDSLCYTHNKPETSISHLHYDFQSFCNIESIEVIDVYKLSSF